MDECKGELLQVLGTRDTLSECDIAEALHGIVAGVEHCHQQGRQYQTP